MKKTTSGFTIVELLIVIVVIAILAAITVVAYNGIQARAQDAQIRSIASQFAKSFNRWSVESGVTTYPGASGSTAYSGGTCTGGSGGWLTRNAGYTCTIDNILVDGGYIPATLSTNVPNTQKSRPGYYSTLMLYGCPYTGATTTRYVMMYALNTPDPSEITNIRTACASGGTYGPIDTYGMNGGFVFSLSS